ncbi:hypothetical protein ACQ10Q_13670, partial [Enterococcus faecalis]|uniref:hypothetical protein n=1 Tax=Enterococcus faecalis TaxID=1351 RepID=UPI003D6AFCC6
AKGENAPRHKNTEMEKKSETRKEREEKKNQQKKRQETGRKTKKPKQRLTGIKKTLRLKKYANTHTVTLNQRLQNKQSLQRKNKVKLQGTRLT